MPTCWKIHATDLSNGVMLAVPAPEGKTPVIDGDLKDWDLSAAEEAWMTPETADRFHARITAMYDENVLYFGAIVSLPGRALRNPNSPVDPFWQGDCLQLRLVSDPSLPWPAEGPALLASDRVAHLSLWKDTQSDKDYMDVSLGAKFNKGHALNPPGSAIVIKAHDQQEYVVESRIPWSALNAPNGKNPFRPGEKMTFLAEILWDSNTLRVAAIYRENPGVFAFLNPAQWGRLEFSPKGRIEPRHPTMQAVLGKANQETAGVPIEVQLPESAKVSLNIIGTKGEVLREITGGEFCNNGRHTWRWDGRDQWGAPLPPGTYSWGAYLSSGLRARWMGTVGISGNPPYQTEDGKGGWGGDHSDPVDVAADETGLYFLWKVAEEGKAVVKTDFDGKVIWRKTPFVGGGFGPLYSIAANGKNAYVVFGLNKPQLLKLDAGAGKLIEWDHKGTLMPIADTDAPKVKDGFAPFEQPETCGIACNSREMFASVYSKNIVRVLDAETAVPLRELRCPAPRGMALDSKGNLFVVSWQEGQPGRVMKFTGAKGEGQTVVANELVAPWDVAVDGGGRLHVTDCGSSQQVKIFSADGKLLRTMGRPGGRPWAGAYDASSFLNPSGIAADSHGGILVAESSIPKPISRFDAQTGALLQRWFGAPAYAATNIPDSEDPWTNYYSLETGTNGGFARARIPQEGGTGFPTAYWDLLSAGYPAAGEMLDTMNVPELFVAANGRKYLVCDSSISQNHGICLVEGDQILPVAHARIMDQKEGGGIEFWSDANGDHQVQPGELKRLATVEGKPIVLLAENTGSMHMERNGDLYFVTMVNRILKVPAKSMSPDGSIQWDLEHASYAIPTVLDRAKENLYTTWRQGILGLRCDGQGNIYTCFNTTVPYATEELSRQMKEGIGHAAEFNTVKFAKFGPQGNLLWMAGRKARQAAQSGEMYHFWALGGLVNDLYVAGCSEWGQIYFYTHDGFFVDALMNDPALGAPAGPYTFGGETFAGRVQYFPKLDEVWAYSCGNAYRVEGFKRGMVSGEKRISGAVVLDKVYDLAQGGGGETTSLEIVSLTNPLKNPGVWDAVPVAVLNRNSRPLATAQLGYDAEWLYARIHVVDDTPLKNSADNANLVFKGGDCVGLDLGLGGQREKPQAGDLRLLAAMIQGQPRLIAFKPFTHGEKHPERYFTPSGGEVRFEYVGDVKDGKVTLVADADGKGYTAFFAVPRSFLEVPLTPNTSLAAEIEVLLSGQGARGLQTMSRNYLFTPSTSQTSMVDDVPTESRLYPQYWGIATIR